MRESIAAHLAAEYYAAIAAYLAAIDAYCTATTPAERQAALDACAACRLVFHDIVRADPPVPRLTDRPPEAA